MALGDLKDSLINEARKQASAKIAEANSKAKAIVEDAKKEADRIKEENNRKISSEKDLIEKEMRASTDIEKKLIKLNTVQEIADSYLDEIKKELKESLESKDLLTAIVDKALSYIKSNLQDRDIVLYAGAKTQKLIPKSKGIKVKKMDEEGVIITDESDSFKIDLSVKSLIERNSRLIRSELIRFIREKLNDIDEQGKKV
ncbi:MAG: V-type ATP synthase subunit E [Candidatus Micrarchaeota archaeon]|nr:MAG: V-type ATP synthase subunit E [Candidatus Micrarchaeota archaeon]